MISVLGCSTAKCAAIVDFFIHIKSTKNSPTVKIHMYSLWDWVGIKTFGRSAWYFLSCHQLCLLYSGNYWNPFCWRREVLHQDWGQRSPSRPGISEQGVPDIWPGMLSNHNYSFIIDWQISAFASNFQRIDFSFLNPP